MQIWFFRCVCKGCSSRCVCRGETSNSFVDSFVGLKSSLKTRKRPVQLRGICDEHLLSFVSSLSSSSTSAAFQCLTANKINCQVHTDTWAAEPTEMAVIPTWLSLCRRDGPLHSLTASSLPGLLDSFRGMQKWLGRSVEKSRLLAPEPSVGHRVHFPRVKAISYGLGSTLKTLLRLLQSTYMIVLW